MSHFYGSITGSAGDATRAGTKSSGFEAWAQNGTGRVYVDLLHGSGTGRDYARVSIVGSTLNHGAGLSLDLGEVDLSAIVEHSGDASVRRHVERAKKALEAANARACKLAKVSA